MNEQGESKNDEWINKRSTYEINQIQIKGLKSKLYPTHENTPKRM